MAEIIVVGSFVQDLAFRTNQFPGVGETRIGTFEQGPGGKGFNQAVACARVGGDTLFIGALGEDVFAETAGSFAKQVGLETKVEVAAEESTGAASIIVDSNGDNQIVVALGANGVLDPAWIESAADEFVSAKVILCQLEANLPAMRKALEMGTDNGAVTILNTAPINEAFEVEMLRSATVVTPNETEFAFVYRKVTGKELPVDYFTGDDETLHGRCRELGVPVVVITLGDEGAFISVDEEKPLPGGLKLEGKTFTRVPPIAAKAVDTTGAGDAFSGGFASGVVRYGGDLKKALAFASTVAGLSVEKPGTAPSMPAESEVLDRLK